MKWRRFLILLYFAIWFLFGCYYAYISEQTSGHAFIFQESLMSKSKRDAVTKIFGIKIPSHLLEDILNESLDGRILGDASFWTEVFHLSPSKAPKGPISTRPIGNNWGYVYSLLYRENGDNWVTIENISSEPFPILGFFDDVVGVTKFNPVCASHPMDLKLVTFRLWKGPASDGDPDHKFQKESLIAGKEIICYLPPEILRYLTDLEKSKETMDPILKEIYPKGFFDFYSVFNFIIPFSYNFLDRSPNEIRNIQRGYYKRPLIDFLYFSAITITTVGYGDILPNDTNIRVAVMVEAFLGVLVIGIYISSIFVNPPSGEGKK